MMMTMTMIRLSLVVAAGEGPTIPLPGLARPLGQHSPHGTSNIGSTKSISQISLHVSLGLTRILVCISSCTSGSFMVYIPFTFVWYLDIFASASVLLERLYVVICHILFKPQLHASRFLLPGSISAKRGGGTRGCDYLMTICVLLIASTTSELLVSGVHLEPWSHRCTPQNPVSSSMQERF